MQNWGFDLNVNCASFPIKKIYKQIRNVGTEKNLCSSIK